MVSKNPFTGKAASARNGWIRPPAVAGTFYPGDPAALTRMVERFLDDADDHADAPQPKAIIAPHAGYIYSGPVAGSAYACFQRTVTTVSRIVLIGPSHRFAFRGVALSGADHFATPGVLSTVDHEAMQQLAGLPGVVRLEEAHQHEHGLEVHLPFLHACCAAFEIVPLVVGHEKDETVAALLAHLWGGPETLVVVSSDLSHYLDYDSARAIDQTTSTAVESLDPGAISDRQACGHTPVRALLMVARNKGLTAKTLDLRNSGDTAGDKKRVVGYGAYHFTA